MNILDEHSLSVLRDAVRPKLWLYWIYDSRKPNDEFAYSEVLEMKERDDVYEWIFDTYIRHFFREGLLKTWPSLVEHLRDYAETCNKRCEQCNKFLFENRPRPCADHYPSTREFLRALSLDGFDRKAKIDSIEYLIKGWKVKIKPLWG
jgi:hypothetical protein